MEFFGSMMDSGSSEDGEELYVLLDCDENFTRKKRGWDFRFHFNCVCVCVCI